RHDRVRTGADDVRDLSVEDRPRELRLGDVVCARAAAAPVRLFERDDLQTRYCREQRSWLRTDLLPVQQVTGIVPGHLPPNGPRPLADPEVAEEFGRVPDLRSEGAPHAAAGGQRAPAARLAARRHRARSSRARAIGYEIEEVGHAARHTDPRRAEERTHPDSLRRDGELCERTERATMGKEPLE